MTQTAMPRAQDCWKHIGVQGDRSCERLPAHGHCQHCPVFAAAAKQLLQREVDATQMLEAQQHYSAARADAPSPERADAALLVFRVGGEWLGLPSGLVDEVAEMQVAHPLPHRSGGALLGIVNVRGELLACLSLGLLLGIGADAAPAAAEPARQGRARLLVLRPAQGRLACPVDEVHGIQRFALATQQTAPPASLAKAGTRYTRALLPWRTHSLGLLDEQLLLHSMAGSLT